MLLTQEQFLQLPCPWPSEKPRETLLPWRCCRLPFNRHRYGVPSAQTKRGNSALHVASHHFIDEGDQDPGAASADG